MELILRLVQSLYGQIYFMISLLSLGSYASLSFCLYIWYISSMCGMWYVCIFFCILCKPTIYHLFWRLEVIGWLEKIVCNSVFLVCIDGLHKAWLIYLIHMPLLMHLTYMSHFDICMCLGGTLLEVSSQIICDNSMCFVIIKKGEFVGPKAFHPSFDDD